MITIDEYVGIHVNSPDWTPERQANAANLLTHCAALRLRMAADGVIFKTNPKTGTCISGEIYGGFRPQDCPIGAPHSNHKEGLAVDNFDPDEAIDNWLMNHEADLEFYGIYIEHPDTTPGWSHWSIKLPGSGHHVFYP
jgi:hypothetical protein